jgi:hypothetical protein
MRLLIDSCQESALMVTLPLLLLPLASAAAAALLMVMVARSSGDLQHGGRQAGCPC